MQYVLVEKKNHRIVHGIFDSKERTDRHLKENIPNDCARQSFMDKTLTPESFEVIPRNK